MRPDGVLSDLTKQVIETALEAEMIEHLGYEKHDPEGRDKGNSRNGTRSMTVLTDVDPVEVEVPRDRDGSFEPGLVRKRQHRTGSVDELVISLTGRRRIDSDKGYPDAWDQPRDQARPLLNPLASFKADLRLIDEPVLEPQRSRGAESAPSPRPTPPVTCPNYKCRRESLPRRPPSFPDARLSGRASRRRRAPEPAPVP